VSRDADGERMGDLHSALASPTRRRLLELLSAGGRARDAHDLAAEVGLHLTTVRFHLEVLRRAGLLARRQSPRAGAGRPRAAYYPVSRPGGDGGRDGGAAYEQLASLLAAHLADTAEARTARSQQAGVAWAERLVPAAARAVPRSAVGPDAEEAARAVSGLFDDLGFDPELTAVAGEWQIGLHACPFRTVARQHPEVVCALHLGLLRGSLARLGAATVSRLLPFVEPELCVAAVAPEH
jgi:predicted ArsR family transcriptional regulator